MEKKYAAILGRGLELAEDGDGVGPRGERVEVLRPARGAKRARWRPAVCAARPGEPAEALLHELEVRTCHKPFLPAIHKAGTHENPSFASTPLCT